MTRSIIYLATGEREKDDEEGEEKDKGIDKGNT